MKSLLIAMGEGFRRVDQPTYLVLNWNGQLFRYAETCDTDKISTDTRLLPINSNIF